MGAVRHRVLRALLGNVVRAELKPSGQTDGGWRPWYGQAADLRERSTRIPPKPTTGRRANSKIGWLALAAVSVARGATTIRT